LGDKGKGKGEQERRNRKGGHRRGKADRGDEEKRGTREGEPRKGEFLLLHVWIGGSVNF
jgi:hypothetical protein